MHGRAGFGPSLQLVSLEQFRRRQANYLLNEYEDGDFYRVFEIHESIDTGKIEAECKNGVLTVHLPKVEAMKPKQIKVRS
jgi:HSP20 family molecular chaperone IbpA